MSIKERFTDFIPQIEAELQNCLKARRPDLQTHYAMMQYHMGWLDRQLAPAKTNRGKRVRPVICLLACLAAGGRVEQALPMAAALEIVHNFSLVHDDIEDDSSTRHHRPTVWKLWGIPLAINVGDGMFALARRYILDQRDRAERLDTLFDALVAFDDACVAITEGQYLDMSFEHRLDVSVDEYLTMIGGKTAALLSACAETGAILAGAGSDVAHHFAQFGRGLGLTFQIQDDILGIWGDEAVTGKSAASDILTRKKTLPVLYSLSRVQSADMEQAEAAQALVQLYAQPTLASEEVPTALSLLDACGARKYAEAMAEQEHQNTLSALQATGLRNAVMDDLLDLAESLLGRQQ